MIRSSYRTRLLRRLLTGVLVVMALAITGCATHMIGHKAANGAYATVGQVKIINAFVLGPRIGGTLPAGSSASFFLSIHNGSPAADKLVSVTTPAARSVTGIPVAIRPDQTIYLTGPKPRLILTHLTRPVKGGELVTMVLHFQKAGSATIQAPVEPRADYYATYSPPPPAALRVSPSRNGHGHGTTTTPLSSPRPSPAR